MSSMFKFVKSNGIIIDLTEKQVLQLSSKDRINAALADSMVVAYDILRTDEIVGFAMLRNCGDGWFLWNYAIDSRFQNKHYGQNALHELCELFKSNYHAKWITTTYKFGNEIARKMYERVGFVQTDVVCENEIHEVNMVKFLI